MALDSWKTLEALDEDGVRLEVDTAGSAGIGDVLSGVWLKVHWAAYKRLYLDRMIEIDDDRGEVKIYKISEYGRACLAERIGREMISRL